MSLFHDFFTRPGPGIAPDAPRKTGLARLWEILLRDGSSFFRAGILALVSLLPLFMGMDFSLHTGTAGIALVSGAVGGVIAMPQITGLADVILRSLRDEPGYWWHTYRRVWRLNAKGSLIPGALFGLLFAAQVMELAVQLGAEQPNLKMAAISLLGLSICTGMFLYTIAQLALLDLPVFVILKNSLLLFIVSMPQSFAATMLCLVYAGIIVWFWPSTLVFMPFFGIWLPIICSLLILYPSFNECFKIEENLSQKEH